MRNSLNRRRAASIKGFTVLELLMVMAIIGFLAASLGTVVVNILRRAEREKTSALIHKLISAMEQFKNDFQQYPPLNPAFSSPTQSLSYYLCNPFVTFNNLPKQAYLSESEIKSSGIIADTADAEGKVDTYDTTGSPPPAGTPRALEPMAIYFKILDIYGNEIHYDPASPKKWSDDKPEWTDNTGMYDLSSNGPDGDPYTIGGTPEDNDDIGNYNTR